MKQLNAIIFFLMPIIMLVIAYIDMRFLFIPAVTYYLWFFSEYDDLVYSRRHKKIGYRPTNQSQR